MAWKSECRLKTQKIKAQKFDDPAVTEMCQKVKEEKTSETTKNGNKDNIDKMWKTLKYTVMNSATVIIEYKEET